MQAHADIQTRIDAFAEESSTALAQCDALYHNISYPLSATLCHTDTLPQATIATHLSNLKHQVASAMEEMKDLGDEWEACAQAEVDAWKELTEARPVGVDAETARMMAAFKKDAKNIVDEKCKLLSKLDQVRS